MDFLDSHRYCMIFVIDLPVEICINRWDCESFNIINIFILNQVLPSIFNKVAHKTWHECFVLIKLDSSNSHRQTSSTVVSSHSKKCRKARIQRILIVLIIGIGQSPARNRH